MKQKKVYIELLRIIAAALVIFAHLPASELYMKTTGISQFLNLIVIILTKISVPLFLMISGALLLRKQEDYKTVISKRFIRIFLALVIFNSAIYTLGYLWALHKHEPTADYSIITLIKGIFSGNLDNTGVYWYLYIYLGMLLSLPFMQIIAPKIEKKDFIFLVAVHFIFISLLPILNIVLRYVRFGTLTLNSGFDAPFANKLIFFYPFIGYYLDQKLDIENMEKKHLYEVIGIEIAAILIQCLLTYGRASSAGHIENDYLAIFDYVIAMTTFILIKYLVVNVFPKFKNWSRISGFICFVGPLTFGIYLMDPCISFVLAGKYHTIMNKFLPPFLVGATWTFISMTIGGTITYFLKKLPFFRKVL